MSLIHKTTTKRLQDIRTDEVTILTYWNKFHNKHLHGWGIKEKLGCNRTYQARVTIRNTNRTEDDSLQAVIMEAVHISETSVYLYEATRRHIPEECHLHTRRSKNL
jgi:hypothetical protein